MPPALTLLLKICHLRLEDMASLLLASEADSLVPCNREESHGRSEDQGGWFPTGQLIISGEAFGHPSPKNLYMDGVITSSLPPLDAWRSRSTLREFVTGQRSALRFAPSWICSKRTQNGRQHSI